MLRAKGKKVGWVCALASSSRDRRIVALTHRNAIHPPARYIARAMTPHEPSWRKPAGITAILLLIVTWAVLVATFAPFIARWPALVQALFYLVVGIAWIVPLGPLLRWSQTGRWRRGDPD